MSQGWIGGKPDGEWWIRQVREGMNFRKKYARETEWEKWRRWYRGEWPRGVLPTNIYFKMIRTLVPRVYYRNPSVSITATLPGMEQMIFAKLLERADNKLFDLMGVKQQMKRAVQLAIMFGTSVPIMGFGAKFSPTPEELSTDAPDAGKRGHKNRLEYNSLIHADTPWFLTCHPRNIVFPDKCEAWDDARWFCQIAYRTVADLQDDPRFKNTANLPEAGKSSSLPFDGGKGRIGLDGVPLWIIRDKKTQQVFVMTPEGDTGKKVLLQADDDLQIDGGLPAYPLVFNTDDESIWGVPDSQIIAPQQTEINEIRTLIMKHRRISLVKFLVEQGAMEPDDAAKLVDDTVGGQVNVKNINMIRELSPAQIPTALLQSEQLTAQDVQEILGLGTNQFGEYAPGSADRSATEANIVAQATQIRVDERRDTCADLLTAFVADMHQVVIKNWSGEMVSDIVGPAGVPIWIKWSPAMLREGHYVVKVDPDTSLPLTKDRREQKAVQGYTILKDNPLINPQTLTMFLVNEMWGGDAADLIKPLANTSPDNPMSPQDAAQHMQQLPQGLGGAQG